MHCYETYVDTPVIIIRNEILKDTNKQDIMIHADLQVQHNIFVD